ncbi:hypothetical protein C362_06961 [Cryptococcus neoformans Bt1]|nr:hypothetical protein C362_06961 [Cryptococcus neoformans var. grubii Bt1]
MQDKPLSRERITEERAFIKRYTESLAGYTVQYPADFSAPLHERPRKVPAIAIPVADPPSADAMDVDAPSQDTVISLTVKSLKPSLTIPVTAQLTDTVSDLKTIISNSSASAPAPDAQRLLLKGKALTDTKLLKEYALESGATVHLIIKASSAAPFSAATPSISTSDATIPPPSSVAPHPPALTITTSVDESSEAGTSMPLTLADQVAPPLGPQPEVSSATFHHTISDPTFWQKIHALCVSEFDNEQEANSAWETFLVSMKGGLSAGEAAKIRDVVGVWGMGGQ